MTAVQAGDERRRAVERKMRDACADASHPDAGDGRCSCGGRVHVEAVLLRWVRSLPVSVPEGWRYIDPETDAADRLIALVTALAGPVSSPVPEEGWLADCENCGHFQDWSCDRTCTHCGWPDQERMRWRRRPTPADPNKED